MKEIVVVNGKNLTIIEWRGQRVITTAQLADVYETDVNNVQNNFSNNQKRFKEKLHYYYLTGNELKTFKNQVNDIDLVAKNTSQLYLWTERGASRHCKILDTDMSWKQFDVLEANYFNPQPSHTITYQYPVNPAALDSATNSGRLLERVMKSQGVPPHQIAEVIRSVFQQAGIELPDFVVKVPAYEQMTLDVYISSIEGAKAYLEN